MGLYQICCGLSWCPARCRQYGSPGGSRSCSKAASASESLSDGLGPPGFWTASLRTPGAPAAAPVLPSSAPLRSCSLQPRLEWEQNVSLRDPERHPRHQSCPKIRWRSSQPLPLPPSQIRHPVLFYSTEDPSRGPSDEQRASVWASEGEPVKRSKRKVECARRQNPQWVSMAHR